jgi:hypothetical protein
MARSPEPGYDGKKLLAAHKRILPAAAKSAGVVGERIAKQLAREFGPTPNLSKRGKRNKKK